MSLPCNQVLTRGHRPGRAPVRSRWAGTRRDRCSSWRGADAQVVTDGEEASLCWDPAPLQRRVSVGLGTQQGCSRAGPQPSSGPLSSPSDGSPVNEVLLGSPWHSPGARQQESHIWGPWAESLPAPLGQQVLKKTKNVFKRWEYQTTLAAS